MIDYIETEIYIVYDDLHIGTIVYRDLNYYEVKWATSEYPVPFVSLEDAKQYVTQHYKEHLR